MLQKLFMIRHLAFIVLLLAACGNNSNEHATHSTDAAEKGSADMHRNTHTDNALPPAGNDGGAMRSLHTTMATMMDSMQAYKPTGSADYDFAALMRLHHKSAVEMAQAQLQGGKDSTLRLLAQNIINSQQGEMALFQTFLTSNPQPSGNSGYSKNAMGMMTHMDGMQMQGSSVDHMFASMMIPHHQDGVKMAEAYLKEGKDAVLMAAARNIVRTQPREVQQLQQWLNQHKDQ